MTQLDTKFECECLFLDIGGVVLSDGWAHEVRRRAAANFGLDYEELEARHKIVFEVHEAGKISLDDYLKQVIFYEKRSFSFAEFKQFMFAESSSDT